MFCSGEVLDADLNYFVNTRDVSCCGRTWTNIISSFSSNGASASKKFRTYAFCAAAPTSKFGGYVGVQRLLFLGYSYRLEGNTILSRNSVFQYQLIHPKKNWFACFYCFVVWRFKFPRTRASAHALSVLFLLKLNVE